MFVLLLALSAAPRPVSAQRPPILGAKVYRPAGDSKVYIDLAKALGLNTLFVGDELGKSREFRDACRKAGLKYYLIVRTFNDPEAASEDPSLVSVSREGRPARRDGDAMICPSRRDFRQAKMARIAEAIRRLDPDGLTLDYFRFFIYWEGVDPRTGPRNFPAFCFDRNCLEEFLRSSRVKVRNTVVGDSVAANHALIEEIWQRHRDTWYAWRVQRIAENAREFTEFLRREFPGMPLALHAVPWSREEFAGARESIVGQDLRLLAPFFDYVSPMEYSALTRRGAGWVARLNRQLLREVPAAKLLPSIEVGPDGPEFPPMPPAQYEADLQAALRATHSVVFYHLELLLADPARQALTRRLLARSR